jgi:hypothetical protein
VNDKDDASVKAALANGAVAATSLTTSFTDGALLLFKDIGAATTCSDASNWAHVVMMSTANTAYGINSLGLASGMEEPGCMSLDADTGAEKIDLSKFTAVAGTNGLYKSAAGKQVCIFMNNCAFIANNNARFKQKAFRSGKKISA